jgi:hypothetical protein
MQAHDGAGEPCVDVVRVEDRQQLAGEPGVWPTPTFPMPRVSSGCPASAQGGRRRAAAGSSPVSRCNLPGVPHGELAERATACSRTRRSSRRVWEDGPWSASWHRARPPCSTTPRPQRPCLSRQQLPVGEGAEPNIPATVSTRRGSSLSAAALLPPTPPLAPPAPCVCASRLARNGCPELGMDSRP